MRQVTKHRTIHSQEFLLQTLCLQGLNQHLSSNIYTSFFRSALNTRASQLFYIFIQKYVSSMAWLKTFFYGSAFYFKTSEFSIILKEIEFEKLKKFLFMLWDKPWVKLPAENINLSISRPLYMSVFVCRCLSSLCLQFQLLAFIFFLLGTSCLSCPCPTSPLRCASAFPPLAASLISGNCTSPVPSYMEPFRKGFVTQCHHKDW